MPTPKNWGKNPISNRPEDQKKGLDAMAKGRALKALNDVEFKTLVRTDRIAALEYLAGDLAMKARQLTQKTDELSNADVQVIKELRQTIETLERYVAARTADEVAEEFFVELEQRIEPAITSLSLETLPKAILDQLSDSRRTHTSPGSTG